MDKDLKERIGRRIIKLRVNRGFRRRELANSLGLGYNCLQRVESGANLPSMKTALLLARKFKVTLDYLVCRGTRKPA